MVILMLKYPRPQHIQLLGYNCALLVIVLYLHKFRPFYPILFSTHAETVLVLVVLLGRVAEDGGVDVDVEVAD
jgi:hypothetical protein